MSTRRNEPTDLSSTPMPGAAIPAPVERSTSSEANDLLSKRDLARFLQVSTRTVATYQRRGLPYFRLGARRNRYDLAVVRQWLDSQMKVVRIR